MKNYECTFVFNTTVQTHGRNEEGAIENLDKFINQEVICTLENIMECAIDYDRDNVVVREIENGWFELTIKWYGAWSGLNVECECEAIKKTQQMLDDKLTPFYQSMENMSTKNRRFSFINLGEEEVDGVYPYDDRLLG